MAVDIRRCQFSLRHAIASWRQQFVECEMVLQTDKSESDSDGTVQNLCKSQLRVDSSFRITRDCPQTFVPFGVFTLYLAVRDSPRGVFPG
jgi:hypothetical protein